MSNAVGGFSAFSESITDGPTLPIELYIAERGIIIPREQWRKTTVGAKSDTGLNFGEDSEETLYKYTDKAGVIGPVAKLNVVLPVQIDQAAHAAHQMYRWEHRFDQVDQAEVMSNVELAAPKIAELVFQGILMPGVGANSRRGTKSDYNGLVWLYNIDTGLNVIVQVKPAEQRGEQAFKIAIITILRRAGITFSKASVMPKITVSATEARVVYTPPINNNNNSQ